jgi:GNAT superfamily N-acetyltransferase
MGEADAIDYWTGLGRAVFVAEADGRVVGTYFLRGNQLGGGDHVANAAYATDPSQRGRGIARRSWRSHASHGLAEHSMEAARARGFLAMQFNFVVSSNESAVHLWESLGFKVVGRLPCAFRHPRLGLVDALVMFRRL